MRRTVRLALAAGASIGAHPGYPDLVGFGRRALAMSAEELEAAVDVYRQAIGSAREAADPGAEGRASISAYASLWFLNRMAEATATLEALRSETTMLRVLGAYPRARDD